MRLVPLIFLSLPLVTFSQPWSTGPAYPGAARDDAALLSGNDEFFVGTGLAVGWNLTNDFYRFTAGASGNWTQVASLPASPRQYCTTFGKGSYYLFGGLDADTALRELWSYDPTADQWTQMSSIPALGRYASVGFRLQMAGQDFLFLVGGILADGSTTDEVWRYSIVGDSWSIQNAFPGTARHRAASAIACGSAIVSGGADNFFNPLNDVWKYNAVSDSWSPLANLPDGRYGGSMVGLGADAIQIGGASSSTNYHDNVWRYNCSQNTWTNYLSPFPSARKGAVMAISTTIPAVFFGLGITSDGTRHSDWWVNDHTLHIAEVTATSFTTYPNPSSLEVKIIPAIPGRSFRLDCFNALGEVVQSDNQFSGGILNVSTWNSGIYSIALSTADGNRTVQKLVVY